MVLVSGRPISFQMDLYQPLYVPRPMVEPELFASLRPPTYNADMREQEKAAAMDDAEKYSPAAGGLGLGRRGEGKGDTKKEKEELQQHLQADGKPGAPRKPPAETHMDL